MTIYCTRAKQQYEAAQAVPPPPHARRVVNPLFKRPPKPSTLVSISAACAWPAPQPAKSNAGGWQVRRPTGPMGRAPAQRSPPRTARAPSAAAVQEVQVATAATAAAARRGGEGPIRPRIRRRQRRAGRPARCPLKAPPLARPTLAGGRVRIQGTGLECSVPWPVPESYVRRQSFFCTARGLRRDGTRGRART